MEILLSSLQTRDQTEAEKDEDVALIATIKSEINNYNFKHYPANSIQFKLKPTHRTAVGRRYHNKPKQLEQELNDIQQQKQQQIYKHHNCNRQYNCNSSTTLTHNIDQYQHTCLLT